MEVKYMFSVWFLLLVVSFAYGRAVVEEESNDPTTPHSHGINIPPSDHNSIDNVISINEHEGIIGDLSEGDIKYSAEQISEMQGGGGVSRDLTRFNRYHWNKNEDKGTNAKGEEIIRIPYTIIGKTVLIDRAVTAAIAEYKTLTCINFVPRTNEVNYIQIFKGGGCYSFVGKIGGMQRLSLGRGCETKGIAIHEMMHALGYFHEQSRSDRDKYIKINFENIPTNLAYNFNKKDTVNQSTTYDTESVMHYGEYAFSINGKKTIERLTGNGKLGQRNGLSEIDKVSLNRLYCPKKTPVKPIGVGGKLPTSQTFCDDATKGGLCKYCSIKEACQCSDGNNSCARYARAGYCTRLYSSWMAKNCPATCFKNCKP